MVFLDFLFYFFLAALDYLNEVRIGQTAVFSILEHQEKSVFDGVFVAALDVLGHLGPLLPETQKKTDQLVILLIGPGSSA